MVEPVGLLKLRLLTSEHWLNRAVGQIFRALTIGVSYHPDRQIRICDIFDWFSPPYPWHHTDSEVEDRLPHFGFKHVTSLSIRQMQCQF